jgi:purine nucleosidase
MTDLIYDCDITMGLPGRDVDDGLALLYLLGSPVIRLLGITSTFGNSSIEEVHPCLLSVLEDAGRGDIPAYRGVSREVLRHASLPPGDPGGRNPRADSDAARFLAETVRANPGTVSILATGSPTNLLGAYRLHPGFFQDVKQLVFMGGIIEPLMINGREMGELNFASDPEAALYALYRGQPPASASGSAGSNGSPPREPQAAHCTVAVISGNLCLQALLTREHFTAFLEESSAKASEGFVAYLEEKILPWFTWIEQVYELPGFHPWDAAAALYLTDPQLFEPREVLLRSTLADLNRGYLRFGGANAGTPAAGIAAATGTRNSRRIDIPVRIRDLPAYWQTLFAGWRRAGTVWPL